MKKSFASARRNTVRLFSYVTALILVLFVFAVSNHTKSEQYRLQMEMSYQRALNELSEYLSDIDTSLSKGVYSNTPAMISEVTSSLVRTSAGAKASLSQLPVSDLQLDNTYKFLSQLGDYSLYLNKKISYSGKLTSEEYENLKSFLPILSGISQEVNSAISSISSGGFFTSAVNQTLSGANGEAQAISFSDSIQSAETNIENYPTLIYDGPYSDHIMQMQAKALESAPEISQEQALSLLENLGLSGLEYAGDENSSIEQYCFSSDSSSVGITKKGGFICYILSDVTVGENRVSTDEAISIAQNFLKKLSFYNMVQSYYSVNGGKCTINFAYKENSVIYYPDLIKITVALDTGNVIGFDARGYLMNHTKRLLSTPSLSQSEAEKSVSPFLKILSSKLCVIPTSGKNEAYCYEFHCSDENGQEYLVYIDTQTGYESDILILLYSDNGILTK